MKDQMRKFFSPILNMFDNGESEYIYRESHRVILKIIGLLFIFLSCGSAYASFKAASYGGILPILVFFLLGIVCEIVAFLGSERAVANIWKSR